MELFDLTFGRTRIPAFDEAPASARRKLFGVDYVFVKGRQGGEFYITRPGWKVAGSILPENWFAGQQFSKKGRALAGATGAVYRVPVPHRVRSAYSIIVKFSRVGQDVGITVQDDQLTRDTELGKRIDFAEFLPPFEEFGNIMKLRADKRRLFATNAPLAIYSPPTRYQEWELGRKSHLQSRHDSNLAQDQERSGVANKVVYNWDKLYILLYQWLDGVDAEQAFQNDMISNDTMVYLSRTMRQHARDLGWVVLDHKPRHVIVRPVRNGNGLRFYKGHPVMGMIDYELLVPAEE
ncbi:MAG: hypothetical protein SFY80_01840 [Verrucomicrobiota bacterium]|nr:hypothetical protein [Verrucomicrobiota bacterium]